MDTGAGGFLRGAALGRSFAERKSRQFDMVQSEVEKTRFPDLAWLTDVREVCRYPLDETRPIWVWHQIVNRRGPSVPHPERHPYCELNLIVRGGGLTYVQRHQIQRQPGDLFMAGPGVPHFGGVTHIPLEAITVYFLPGLLLELGPGRDGGELLQRLAAVQSPADQLLCPGPALRQQLVDGFGQMLGEFERPAFGSELKLRATLAHLLVDIVRSERGTGMPPRTRALDSDWYIVEQALRYLRDHFAEAVYGSDVAAAAGVSERAMRKMFHDCLGMTWVQYLQGYRVHRAAALLMQPGQTVTGAALAVGFEDLSHFNEAFRSFMGVSPSAYVKNPSAAALRYGGQTEN